MIIANGTMEVLLATGGGFDAKGYPIPETHTWSLPVECQIVPIKYNALAKSQDEPITEQSYKILNEAICEISAERLRLKDKKGNEIGEFSIKSIEELEAVNEIQIIV